MLSKFNLPRQKYKMGEYLHLYRSIDLNTKYGDISVLIHWNQAIINTVQRTSVYHSPFWLHYKYLCKFSIYMGYFQDPHPRCWIPQIRILANRKCLLEISTRFSKVLGGCAQPLHISEGLPEAPEKHFFKTANWRCVLRSLEELCLQPIRYFWLHLGSSVRLSISTQAQHSCIPKSTNVKPID